MAITNVRWKFEIGGGLDIHVLAGETARPLDELLSVTVDGTPYDGDAVPNTVKLTYVGEFAGKTSGHGVVSVGAAHGNVQINAKTFRPLPPDRLFNFLVRVEVSDASGTFTTTPRVRFHVHDSLVALWLTPQSLTIRAGATAQVFSVLAEFDDGVIGDVTFDSDLQWSKLAGAITLKPSGALTATSDGDTATVNARIPKWGLQANAIANVNAQPSWATLGSNTKAVHVGGPGPAASANVPNILLLPDGFDDSTAFGKAVRQIVDFLGRDERTSPYKLLKNAVNFWKAFIPSPQKGVTVLHEIGAVQRKAGLMGLEVPTPRQPASTATTWTLDEMINEVGLPIPANAIPANAGEPEVAARLLLRSAEWFTLYGKQADGHVDTELFRNWADLADRRLINERNSALGICFGIRPIRDDTENPPRSLQMNSSRRAERSDLDAFLSALTADGAPQIGKRWGGDPANGDGQDRPFVMVLAAGSRYGGAQSSQIIAGSLNHDTEIQLAAATTISGRAVDIANPVNPATASLYAITLVAHETAHGLGLGDEYGAVGEIPAASIPGKILSPNLQDRATLIAPTSPPQGTATGLKASNLKWLWPRISKAAITTGVITANGGTFEIPHQPFPAGQTGFKEGDLIQVRPRALGAHMPVSSLMFIPLGGATAKDKIVVQPQGAVTVNPTTFATPSIVYVPTIDPLPLGTGQPFFFVHEKVQNRITTTGLPLNAPKNAAPTRACGAEGPDGRQSQVATNLPDDLLLSNGVYRAWVVGAYDGGGEFQCGLYHPAGACLMRAKIFRNEVVTYDFTKPTVPILVVEELVFTFCPVCRYALVDKIDPTQHGEVDKWYQTRYPG